MTVGPTLKDFTNEHAVKGKVGTNLDVVLVEGLLDLAGEVWRVLYHRMGVVGHDILHADLYVVNWTHVPESMSVF